MKKKPVLVKISPNKLATPNELRDAGKEAIAKSVNALTASVFSLYVKTKNFHWHMSGPHYRDYHLLLDEQADQLFAMIDVLAERVRKLGKITLHSVGEIARLSAIKDNDEKFVDAHKMLLILMEDNKQLASMLLECHELCDKYNDVATASLLENYIDETERRIWFLFECAAV
jgi:starvation-inducible DNA-binding protein